MVFFNLFRARNAPSEITKDSESMKDSARELNIFTGLQRIIPVIRRMTHVEASMLLIPDYYSDDIVTFSFSNTDTIYIRVVADISLPTMCCNVIRMSCLFDSTYRKRIT